MKVFPSLIIRRKNHFHNLICGVSVIIGNNGYIWISPQEHDILFEETKEEHQNYVNQVSKFKCTYKDRINLTVPSPYRTVECHDIAILHIKDIIDRFEYGYFMSILSVLFWLYFI